MPNSKRRKRLIASNKKQIERARRRIEAQGQAEANKENSTTIVSALPNECRGIGQQISPELFEEERHRSVDQPRGVDGSNPGWFGGLYSWCHTGIVQVKILSLLYYIHYKE